MPITPSGTRTREILSPFGRSQDAIALPTGSGRAAISSSPRAMASTRASVSVSRSMNEPGRCGLGCLAVGGVRFENVPKARAQGGGGGAQAAVLLLSRGEGQHVRGGLRLLANREQVFAELRAGFGVHWSNR